MVKSEALGRRGRGRGRGRREGYKSAEAEAEVEGRGGEQSRPGDCGGGGLRARARRRGEGELRRADARLRLMTASVQWLPWQWIGTMMSSLVNTSTCEAPRPRMHVRVSVDLQGIASMRGGSRRHSGRSCLTQLGGG